MPVFTVELWAFDGSHRLAVLASAESFADANETYKDAVANYPGELVILRRGERVIRKSKDVKL